MAASSVTGGYCRVFLILEYNDLFVKGAGTASDDLDWSKFSQDFNFSDYFSKQAGDFSK